MSFLSWLRGWTRRSRPDLDICLYTRRGCHLCEDALAVLEKARTRWGFMLRVVDVDTDPALIAEHGEWVPVVTVDGKVRFRGRVNEVLLTRLLRAGGGR